MSPSGPLVRAEEITDFMERGHEIGCHIYSPRAVRVAVTSCTTRSRRWVRQDSQLR
jgi:hypothetical protein